MQSGGCSRPVSVPGWRAMPSSEMGNSGGGSSVGVTFGGKQNSKAYEAYYVLSTVLSRLQSFPHIIIPAASEGRIVIIPILQRQTLCKGKRPFTRQRGLSEFPKVTQLGNGRARISNPDWLAPESIHFTISCNADSHQTLFRHLQLKILVGQLGDDLINNFFII